MPLPRPEPPDRTTPATGATLGTEETTGRGVNFGGGVNFGPGGPNCGSKWLDCGTAGADEGPPWNGMWAWGTCTPLDGDRALVDVGATLGLGAVTQITLGYQGALGGRANDHAVRLMGQVAL